MGVTIAAARVAVNTSTGTQTITTTDLGGLTPKAAILMMSGATSDGTAADGAQMWAGITNGTASYALGFHSVHNVGTTDTHSSVSANGTVMLFNTPGTGTVVAQADFDSWTTNGIVIDWVDAPESAFLLSVLFFAGTDVTAHVGSAATDLQAVDTPYDVNTVGFEPEFVFMMASLNLEGTAGDSVNNTRVSYGAATWDLSSTIEQVSWGNQWDNGAGDTNINGSYVASNRIISILTNSGGLNHTLEIGSFDASGFSVTPRTTACDQDIYYLCLEFSGLIGLSAGITTTPTSQTEQLESGPNFKPQAVLLGTTLIETTDSETTNSANAASIGMAFIDADEEYSVAATEEHNVVTTNNQSLADNVCANIPLEDGSAGVVAEAPASNPKFDTTGFRLDYTTVTGTGKKWWYVAFEEEAAATVDKYEGFNRTMQPGYNQAVASRMNI